MKPTSKNALRTEVAQWGEGYFDLDKHGRLRALPDQKQAFVLEDVVEQARDRGARLPLLLRFPDVLQHRARQLRAAFDRALEERGLQSRFTPVYPIKVNQQAAVVQALAEVEGMGLEAGSKPELLATLAAAEPGRLLICNGWKDAAYLRLVQAADQLGLRPIVVIEKLHEWALIERQARRSGYWPRLGVRLRLSSLGAGNWQNTGGERAKFGLTAAQLMTLVQAMGESAALHRLELLHFHMGSQISSLDDIRLGLREAGRYFAELVAAGAPMNKVDIGGGLGVDYQGGGTQSFYSMNYSVQDYARTVVEELYASCQRHQLPMPDLVSESGRALSAHHAVLVTRVNAAEYPPLAASSALAADDPPQLVPLQQQLQALEDPSRGQAMDQAELQRQLKLADQLLAQGREAFVGGELDLAGRARLEPTYNSVLTRLHALLDPTHAEQRQLADEIELKLAAKYFINLSVFQSLPDIWAIDQVFPILPLSRLDEPREERAVLEDLTCDSDGRVEHYVEQGRLTTSLAVHRLREDEDYLLGIFLTGAYQEALGDIHNLFGDTDSIEARLNDSGGLDLSELRAGDSAADLLRLLGHHPKGMLQIWRERMATIGMERPDAKALERLLREELHAWTYPDP